MSAAAESEGLTGFRIDFEGRCLPAHRLIIEQSWENESVNCGRWMEDSRGKMENSKPWVRTALRAVLERVGHASVPKFRS